MIYGSPKQNATKGYKGADEDCWCHGASDVLGLVEEEAHFVR